MDEWIDIEEGLAARLMEAGLDLCAATQVGRYNATIAARAPEFELPDYGNPRSLVVVIGNTRALWPRLLEAMAEDETLMGHPDPVDTYAQREIERAVGEVVEETGIEASYRLAAHVPERGASVENGGVAIQELARIAGMADLSPSNLAVHPEHGPWIALRAAVVFDTEGPDDTVVVQVCKDCEAPCTDALEAALQATRESQQDEEEPLDDPVARHWEKWLDVREACPVGEGSKYPPEQSEYHYKKDREQLRGQAKKQPKKSKKHKAPTKD